MIHFTGKVVHLEIEGGFWGLKADDGKNYDPLDMPSQFEIEGMRVEATLRAEKDIATIHMWGTPVRVLEIKRVAPLPASNSASPRNPR